MKNLDTLKTQLINTIILITVLFLYVGATYAQKIEICHVPPGNPENAHTIEISVNALAAHLAHGDYEGACSPRDEPFGYFSVVVAPNPYVEVTKISCSLSRDAYVGIEVYDQQGTQINAMVSEQQDAGDYSYELSSADTLDGAGLYYLKCTVLCGSESITETKTLVQL